MHLLDFFSPNIMSCTFPHIQYQLYTIRVVQTLVGTDWFLSVRHVNQLSLQTFCHLKPRCQIPRCYNVQKQSLPVTQLLCCPFHALFAYAWGFEVKVYCLWRRKRCTWKPHCHNCISQLKYSLTWFLGLVYGQLGIAIFSGLQWHAFVCNLMSRNLSFYYIGCTNSLKMLKMKG